MVNACAKISVIMKKWRSELLAATLLLLCLPPTVLGGFPGSVGFDIVGSDSVPEDNGLVSVCLRIILNTNAPGQFILIDITSTDGTALRGVFCEHEWGEWDLSRDLSGGSDWLFRNRKINAMSAQPCAPRLSPLGGVAGNTRTAKKCADFTFSGYNSSVELIIGNNLECFNVLITADDMLEDDESFTLQLQADIPAGFFVTVTQSALTVVIVNDDALEVCLPPLIHFPEGNMNHVEVCFNVSSTTARDVDITVTKQSPAADGSFCGVVETVHIATIEAGTNSSLRLKCIFLANNTDRTFLVFLSATDPGVIIRTSAAAVTVQEEATTAIPSTTDDEHATMDDDNDATEDATMLATTTTTRTRGVVTEAATFNNIATFTIAIALSGACVVMFVVGVLLGVFVAYCMLVRKHSTSINPGPPALRGTRPLIIEEERRNTH